MAGTKDTKKKSTVIRRVESVEDGHHGGAWKVAYADFVTAMMAFFLLMWIINFVPDETKMGLTSYFSNSPSGIVPDRSGDGGFFGGTTEHRVDGFARETGELAARRATPAMLPDAEDERDGERARPTEAGPDGPGGLRPAELDGMQDLSAPPGTRGEAFGSLQRQEARLDTLALAAEEALRQELEERENARFAELVEQIRERIEEIPDLSDLGGQIRFEIDREGLRIHFTDAGNRPMFPLGGATPNPWFVQVLTAISPTLLALPNMISISGHTDSTPFRGGARTNWDLSTDRAIATRRLLLRAGLPDARIANVGGFADRRPIEPNNPEAAVNRRVSLLLLRHESAPSRR
jgi:chemotaxis protein MotB